jgi:hypothetical protein
MISICDLSRLPDVDRLRRTLQSMALLDAIIYPEWQNRYYSFDAGWCVGEQMGSMRNGSGDDFFALFNAAGCCLKGFAHEALMSPYRDDGTIQIWPGIIDPVPEEFATYLQEPAFSVSDTTFCIWRRYGDAGWQRGRIEFPPNHRDPDGSEDLLSPLDGDPETYQAWAEKYYERPVSLGAVRQIYDHEPLTIELINRLKPDLSFEDLQADIDEIGYPAGIGRP